MSSLPTLKILEHLVKTQGRYPVWEIGDLAIFAIWEMKILSFTYVLKSQTYPWGGWGLVARKGGVAL